MSIYPERNLIQHECIEIFLSLYIKIAILFLTTKLSNNTQRAALTGCLPGNYGISLFIPSLSSVIVISSFFGDDQILCILSLKKGYHV
jgi:hypothetical protein